MSVNSEPNNIHVEMGNNREALENVDCFVYLGSTIAHDGDISRELDCRLGKSAGAFKTLKPINTDRTINLKTKVRIYEAVVITTLLYGSEAWNISVQDEGRLAAFHTRCLRRLLGVNWQDHVTNEELFRRTGTRPLLELLRRKRLTWFGHVCRMDSVNIARRLYKWAPLGRRSRGGQRTRWSDVLNRDLSAMDIRTETAELATADRRQWRKIVSALCGAGLPPATAVE